MTGAKEMTPEYVSMLKNGSIALARMLGYQQEEIDLLQSTNIDILDEELPEGHWYGRAHLSGEETSISLYKRNLLASGKRGLIDSLEKKGMSGIKLDFLKLGLMLIPEKELKYLFDQSGMDHELLGHIANYFVGKDCGETAAVQAQLQAFKLRKNLSKKGIYRAILDKVGKMILMQHKGDEIRNEQKNI